jgi:hypothetical protein
MILLAHPFQSGADVNVKKTLQMENSPLDVAVSRNGRWIFILSDSGQILIYSSNGQMVKKIIVGNHVDKIEVGPLENILLLVSKEKKIIEVINLKLPIGLDISGSPSKGPEHAPVVITVFSDFQ